MTEWTYDWAHRIYITTPKGHRRQETDVAWEYFTCYRDMGYERTHVKVAKKYGKEIDTIRTYANKYNWDSRINEMTQYEDHQKQKKLHAQQETVLTQLQKDTLDDNKILTAIEKAILIEAGLIENQDGIKEKTTKQNLTTIGNTLSQINIAKRSNRQDILRAFNMPEKINDKQEVNMESEVTAEVKADVNIQDQELNQKIIMNPNYAKLTREVLDDLTTTEEEEFEGS